MSTERAFFDGAYKNGDRIMFLEQRLRELGGGHVEQATEILRHCAGENHEPFDAWNSAMLHMVAEPYRGAMYGALAKPSDHQTIPGSVRLAHLGRGGLANVDLAWNFEHRRPVAIKMYHGALADKRPEAMREAVMISYLSDAHRPDIGPLFAQEGEATDGRPYTAIEYVDGISLEQATQSWHCPSVRFSIAVLFRVAAALEHMHVKMDTVHGDVKPENIMYDVHKGWRLWDDGLVTINGEHSEDIRGTPHYLAPELLADYNRHPAADNFALGMMATKLITGHLACNRNDWHGELSLAVRDPMTRRDRRDLRERVPASLERAIGSLLAVDPTRRASAGSLAIACANAWRKLFPKETPLPGGDGGFMHGLGLLMRTFTRRPRPTPTLGPVDDIFALPTMIDEDPYEHLRRGRKPLDYRDYVLLSADAIIESWKGRFPETGTEPVIVRRESLGARDTKKLIRPSCDGTDDQSTPVDPALAATRVGPVD